MLKKLSVKNYVIIDRLEIDFSNSLNIITGETGAGKSILLGALSLVLGQRADSKALADQSGKCVIEAAFDISNYNLKDFFENNELDYDKQTILRREISENGKSRAFINDTPVALQIMKELGEQLVNVHSQHETLSLSNPAFQTQLTDGFAAHQNLLETFAQGFQNFKKEKNKLEQLRNEYEQLGGDTEYLSFQLKELEEAALQHDEQAALEQELRTLEHAEEIKSALSKATLLLSDADDSVNHQLLTVSEILHSLQKYLPETEELLKRTESAYLELKDIADTISDKAERTSVDAGRTEEVSQRLNTIYRLQKKHRATTIEELLIISDNLQEKIQLIEKKDEILKQQEMVLQKLEKELTKLGKQIHDNRKKAVPEIIQQVKTMLGNVGMPHAVFDISIEWQEFEKINAAGFDKIRFLFSANKGMAPDELRKVASGGELSRLMLVLKSLSAKYNALPTLIFDEIDSGISGEIADKAGRLMEQLAQQHQVIAITHLPQIAGKGESHFFVYKNETGAKTTTHIRQLNREERINEIAKMIAGEKVSESALTSAQELLGTRS